uniref:C2H2-type domain-containing protein n=1 Tax=Meloidogyne incognita TaxID=6306 RepID=A0A914ML71_MELIC
MSVQIEQNNEKHYCRVPGCHKVYSESEFLLAHLQWHKNQPPTTARILEQTDQTNEKHICRVPGCHKVYNEISHLMAHLQWHINESEENRVEEIICKIEDSNI